VRTTSDRVIRFQGWYYVVGGLWPIVHQSSFEAIVGPKPDRFQTEVTAALFVAVGAVLLRGSRGGRVEPVTAQLASAAAAATAAVVWRHRHSVRPVLRVEACLETAFAVAAATSHRSRRARR
jgi:hypothetical protein